MSLANGAESGGWFRIANGLIDDHGADVGPHALAVFLALARHADRAGRCWPSLARLAALTGMGRGKVIKSIRCLEKRGLLSKAPSQNPQGPNVYTLLLVPVVNGGSSCGERGVVPVVDTNKTKENKTQRTSAIESTGEANPKTSQALFDTEGIEGKEDTPKLFQEFWSAYPKKTNKPAAIRAWKKLKPSATTIAAILADIASKKATVDWTKSKGQFVPHPASYLNGERWKDEGTTNHEQDKNTSAAQRDAAFYERFGIDRARTPQTA